MDRYSRLQNGSDVRGVALDGVEGEPVTLTADIARTIGYAFAQWLASRLGKSALQVAVGHDSRLSADLIKTAVFQGLEQGEDLQATIQELKGGQLIRKEVHKD